jgi:hypothetical protein
VLVLVRFFLHECGLWFSLTEGDINRLFVKDAQNMVQRADKAKLISSFLTGWHIALASILSFFVLSRGHLQWKEESVRLLKINKAFIYITER